MRRTTGSSHATRHEATDAARTTTSRRTQVTMGMRTRKSVTATQLLTGFLSLAVIAAIVLIVMS